MINLIITIVLFLIGLLFFMLSASAFNSKVYDKPPNEFKMQQNRITFFFVGIVFTLLGIIVIL